MMAEAHAWAIDKPVTATFIRDIVAGITRNSELKNNGYIKLTAPAGTTRSQTVETLKAGENSISITTIPPVLPLEKPTCASASPIPIWRTCQTRSTAKEPSTWRYHANEIPEHV